MKNNLKKLAIGALALAAVVAVIIFGVKLINVIVLNWYTIVDWLSAKCFYGAALFVITFGLGLFIYRKGTNRDFSAGDYLHKHWNEDGEVGKVTMIISAALFFADVFLVFNHFGLLILWLVIVGGIVFLSLLILFIVNVDKIIKGTEIAVILTLIFIMSFTYYLDVFIFSWDRPWISGVGIILIIILIIITRIRSRIKNRKEKLEQAEYDAKSAADEMVKMKNRLEAKSKLELRLASMSLYTIIVSYFNERRNRDTELIYWDDVVSIYLEAASNIKDDNLKKLDSKQKRYVAWLLDRKSADRQGDFLRLAAQVFSAEDIEALLFSNTSNEKDSLPEAFNQYSCKEEVIINFLSEDFSEKYQKIIFNSVKKEFAENEFLGLINTLIYSYGKTWDEERSQKLIDRISEIFVFANDLAESLWNGGNKHRLFIHLEAIKEKCFRSGVQIYLPALKKATQAS